ncbi:MAG: TauD/TfdA family dioxygenase, partial [Psychroserpens sp.]|nr:TauD/TfdA family dioxygenase [Psychroserpens sp.]
NAHLAGIFDLPADRMEAYYRAYRTIMQMTRSDDYVITTRLEGGEMVIFDNRRVLHGPHQLLRLPNLLAR